MANIGTLTAYLGLDTKGLEVGSARAKGLIGRLAGSMKAQVAGIAATLAAGFATKQMISAGMEFGGSIRKAGILMNATTAEIEAMRAAALKMGDTTEWSARSAAEALKELGERGFQTSKALQALPVALDFATAHAVPVAEAVGALDDVLDAFRLGVEDAAHAMDVLTGTARPSTGTLQDILGGLKAAGPTAKALGYTLEETAAMIATLAEAGIDAEKAGQGLAMSMKKANNVAVQFGLPAGDIISVLKQMKAEGHGVQDILAAFGARTATAALALSSMTDTAEGFLEQLRDIDGETKRAADTIRGGLGAAFRSLKAAIEGVSIRVFMSFAEDLKRGTVALTEWVRAHREDLVALLSLLAKVVSGILLILGKTAAIIYDVGEAFVKAFGGAKTAADGAREALDKLPTSFRDAATAADGLTTAIDGAAKARDRLDAARGGGLPGASLTPEAWRMKMLEEGPDVGAWAKRWAALSAFGEETLEDVKKMGVGAAGAGGAIGRGFIEDVSLSLNRLSLIYRAFFTNSEMQIADFYDEWYKQSLSSGVDQIKSTAGFLSGLESMFEASDKKILSGAERTAAKWRAEIDKQYRDLGGKIDFSDAGKKGERWGQTFARGLASALEDVGDRIFTPTDVFGQPIEIPVETVVRLPKSDKGTKTNFNVVATETDVEKYAAALAKRRERIEATIAAYRELIAARSAWMKPEARERLWTGYEAAMKRSIALGIEEARNQKVSGRLARDVADARLDALKDEKVAFLTNADLLEAQIALYREALASGAFADEELGAIRERLHARRLEQIKLEDAALKRQGVSRTDRGIAKRLKTTALDEEIQSSGRERRDTELSVLREILDANVATTDEMTRAWDRYSAAWMDGLLEDLARLEASGLASKETIDLLYKARTGAFERELDRPRRDRVAAEADALREVIEANLGSRDEMLALWTEYARRREDMIRAEAQLAVDEGRMGPEIAAKWANAQLRNLARERDEALGGGRLVAWAEGIATDMTGVFDDAFFSAMKRKWADMTAAFESMWDIFLRSISRALADELGEAMRRAIRSASGGGGGPSWLPNIFGGGTSAGTEANVSPETDFYAAAGGIFASPTRAIIGEAGPEAVIPLPKLRDPRFLRALGRGAGGGDGVTLNMTIQTPDPATFKATQAQTLSRAAVALAQARRRGV